MRALMPSARRSDAGRVRECTGIDSSVRCPPGRACDQPVGILPEGDVKS
jgi:hypothetical protein